MNRKYKRKIFLWISLFVLLQMLLTACSAAGNDIPSSIEKTPEETYTEENTVIDRNITSSEEEQTPETTSVHSTDVESSEESGFEQSSESTSDDTPSVVIHFLDVGQGDAILVMSNDHAMLIDGGNSSKSDVIYTFLKNEKITHLDYLVATHDDADHVGGLSGALQIAEVDRVICNAAQGAGDTFASFQKKVAEKNCQIWVPEEKETFSLGPTMVTVYSPGEAVNSENKSLIIRIECGIYSFLLTGDAETEEEKYMVETYGDELKSTVLKVGHHGSRDSSSTLFLHTVQPEYAVISVGKDNPYGHPSAETLTNIRALNAEVFRTDMQGDIIISVEGDDLSVTASKNSALSQDELCVAGDKSTEDIVREIPATETQTTVTEISTSAETVRDYVVNTNTKKFHYPTCASSQSISEKNRWEVNCTRQELIDLGYVPCKNCNP